METRVIDVQQVRELIQLMVEHGLSEIRIREGEMEVSLRRGPGGDVPVTQSLAGPAAPPTVAPGTPAGPGVQPAWQAPALRRDEGLVPITSPMVGTAYVGHDPESPPFVEVGTEVEPDTTVCIIEAMKVFNEIKAEVAGTVEQILIQNEQPVEYGEPLIWIRPRR